MNLVEGFLLGVALVPVAIGVFVLSAATVTLILYGILYLGVFVWSEFIH